MDIKVHKIDLPEDIKIGNRIAVDCEFMGLNFQRDKLCLVQISSGNSDAHIIQLDRNEYKAPILKKILSDKSGEVHLIAKNEQEASKLSEETGSSFSLADVSDPNFIDKI